MGYTGGRSLPAGIMIYGRPWSEVLLVRCAYSYEQLTQQRYPPLSTPLLLRVQ